MIMKQVLIGIFLVSASWLSVANDEKFVIEDIQVNGLQRVALGAALTHVPFTVGDQISEFYVAQSIKRLYASGFFANIEAFRDGNKIIFKVTERPTISEIEFDGNSDIKDDQLQTSLNDSNIRVGESLDKTVLDTVESGLLDFYHSVGKYNAVIKATVTYLPRNRVKLKFDFDEGDAASIKQINIVGNEVFNDEELLAGIESKQNLSWWQFMDNDRYQKQALKGDMETIRDYYLDRGYLRYNLDSTQVSVAPDKESVYVTLNVSEGEPYTVTGFDFIGDLLGQEEFIRKIVPIRENERYNGALVTYTEEMITKYLGRFGYANAKVSTIPEANDETKEVKLTISVDPGKRVYVRRIKFVGNFSTSDEVLRREMRQFEGATLSNNLLEMSKTLLQRLRYIESVDFAIQELPGEDDQVDVVFRIKEQASGTFQAGISYGDYTGLAFNTSIQQENFLGTGNSVGIGLNTWKAQQTISLNYTDNYFTDDGVSLGGQIAYSSYDASKVNLVTYSRKTVSIGPTLSWPVMENNRISVGLAYKDIEISSLQPYDQIRRFAEAYIDPTDPDAKFDFESFEANIGWSRNTLNRGVFPSDGSSQYYGFKASVPGSDVEYFKFNFDSKFYFPLTDNHKWTLLARLEANYGNGYGDLNGNEQTLPFWENMQQRSNDLRGFESNTIGPKGIQRIPQTISGGPNTIGGVNSIIVGSENDAIQPTFRATGGNASVFGGIELITPTPFLSDDFANSVRTSVFIDAGNVWDTEFDISEYDNLAADQRAKIVDYSDAGRYRVSAGISLQWLSPMGPLVFTWSKPLKEYEEDEHEVFSFNIGTTF
ncbi:outer membrane protein assembly factor BamA [Psychrosphaera aestuarii]|uniref:outer membrane protein assembly factor BamA n=1 Tax=Psychrosphaera aestuarii TaxID=1266052 RepID=UPI001B322A63|nr:outer membrane protein assembly factor BamA [Psychrosphaera aestuarii]